MAGPVSGWKPTKSDRAGSDAGQVCTSKNAALRPSCNVLTMKCPTVSQPCPGPFMQIGNKKRPIHAGFRAVSHLSHLSHCKTVGVERKAPQPARPLGAGSQFLCVRKRPGQGDQATGGRLGLRVLPGFPSPGVIRARHRARDRKFRGLYGLLDKAGGEGVEKSGAFQP